MPVETYEQRRAREQAEATARELERNSAEGRQRRSEANAAANEFLRRGVRREPIAPEPTEDEQPTGLGLDGGSRGPTPPLEMTEEQAGRELDRRMRASLGIGGGE